MVNRYITRCFCIRQQCIICQRFIGAPLCRSHIVISMSARPSVRPTARLRSLVWGIYSLPFAENGSYFTYRVSLCKRCVVTLNKVFWSMVKVISHHTQTKNQSYLNSPLGPILLIFQINTRDFW